MIATSHVIIGGTAGLIVAQTTNSPVAGAATGLAAGIISHLLCDLLPHMDGPLDALYENGEYDRIIWTKGLYAFAITDSLIAFFFTLFVWVKFFHFSYLSPFAWGALGGYLPDLIDNFPLWRDQIRKLPVFKQFHALHHQVHNVWRFRFPMKQYWPLGIITQVVTVVPCLWLLLK